MRRLATAPRAMLRLSLITTVLAHAAGYARVPRHMLHAPRLAPCISCVTKDTLLLESSDSHSLASNPLDSSSQPPPAWRGSDGRRGGGISSSLACWGTPLALGERATSGPRAMRWRSRSSASPRMVLDSTLVAATIGGIFAGGLHAVTGPDHLAALLPLCMGRRWWVALYTGAYWGLGHGIGAALVGALAFAVRGALNLNALSRYMEAAVGISIIIIGANGIREAREWNTDHEGPTEVAKQHSLEVRRTRNQPATARPRSRHARAASASTHRVDSQPPSCPLYSQSLRAGTIPPKCASPVDGECDGRRASSRDSGGDESAASRGRITRHSRDWHSSRLLRLRTLARRDAGSRDALLVDCLHVPAHIWAWDDAGHVHIHRCGGRALLSDV